MLLPVVPCRLTFKSSRVSQARYRAEADKLVGENLGLEQQNIVLAAGKEETSSGTSQTPPLNRPLPPPGNHGHGLSTLQLNDYRILDREVRGFRGVWEHKD